MEFKKFKITGKSFTLRGNYTIHDDNDKEVYTVKGSPFLRKFTMFNTLGEEVLQIRRKVFSLRFTYFIYKDDQQMFKIVRALGFRPSIFVESLIESDAFVMQGNVWDSEYAFYQEDKEFAYVSKKMWSLSGNYGVAIAQGWEEDIVLAMVIIIDVIRRTKNRRR